MSDQENRFKDAGFNQAGARSLWDLWSDDNFLNSSVRVWLDTVEPFDEWEEFALFASHYFLLSASTRQPAAESTAQQAEQFDDQTGASCEFTLVPQSPSESGQRRYGAVIPDSENSLGHHGGLGRQSRLASTDFYTNSKEIKKSLHPFPTRDIPARMCHTVTGLDNGDCLLVGGRASPASALEDCWLRQENLWRPTHSLPAGRFRHSATKVTVNSGIQLVLIYGGKSSDGKVFDSWLQWNEEHGWQVLETVGSRPSARFGACMESITDTSGVMFGGIGQDGTILQDFWLWRTCQRSDGSIFIELSDQTTNMRSATPLFKHINRFGATINRTSWGLVVAGGIISGQTVPSDKEITLLEKKELLGCLESAKPLSHAVISVIGLGVGFNGQRPLLSGHISYAVDPYQLLILGGGAVCFSFGTFWTEGTWLLKRADSTNENTWSIMPENLESVKNNASEPSSEVRNECYVKAENIASIPRVQVKTASQFQQIVAAGKPVVIEGCDIGPCTERWTKEYLINAVGRDRKVYMTCFLHLGLFWRQC